MSLINGIYKQRKLKLSVTLFFFFCFLASNAFSQYKNITVNKSRTIFEPEEPAITINPTNPLNILAAANIDFYYYTFDGGATWTEGKLPGPIVYGDPVVYFDAMGNAYYTHLGPFNKTGIYWAKSTDGGVTWSDSHKIYGEGNEPFQDKEWITSDVTNSPFKNNLYVSWTQFDKYESKNPKDSSIILFSRSTNLGTSFTYPIRISDLGGDSKDGDSTVEGAVSCVGPEGQVYVAWAGPRGIEFDKSLDGGMTFNKDVWVCNQVGGWAYDIPGLYRCNGLPFTACDISNSKYNGTIYINFSDERNGDHDVFIVKSTDEGATWGEPVRVNNDELGNGKEQFMSNFSVDPATGYIYVLFYDRRRYDDNQTDVVLAVSKDGGETFENMMISDSPFIPVKRIFFGDYIDIDVLNGLVACVWTRMDNEKLSIIFWKEQF
ncbi:MAG TPA: sialidase family protein [Ignavibacteria bacterium]|nr:sialidase family protein [Ignavibacteria bacterium]